MIVQFVYYLVLRDFVLVTLKKNFLKHSYKMFEELVGLDELSLVRHFFVSLFDFFCVNLAVELSSCSSQFFVLIYMCVVLSFDGLKVFRSK